MKPNQIIKYTGGSRIGARNLTIPLASLRISEEKLQLRNFGFKTLNFKPEDLVNIEEVQFLPVIAQGIRIVHHKPNYPESIIFWSLTDPEKIVDSIVSKGLTVKTPPSKQHTKEGKRVLIPPIVMISVLLTIFFGGSIMFLDSRSFDHYSTLSKSSEIKLEVSKMSVDHGSSFINNQFIVPLATKLISTKPVWFKRKFQAIGGKASNHNVYFSELHEPFTILKNRNSLELTVIKNQDTLTFELPDPNYKDPNDLTFKDLFEKLIED